MSQSTDRLRGDFERIVALALVTLLVVAVFLLLRPFLGAIVWAAVLAVAVRPAYLRLRATLGGRERLAAVLVCLALTAALIAPLAVLGVSLADNVDAVAKIARDLVQAGGLPGPPAWVETVPLLGGWLHAGWTRASTDSAWLLASAQPYIERVASWGLEQGARLGASMLEFLLAVVISGFLCVHGESAGAMAERVARRLGGMQAPMLLTAAATTVRGVAAGVIGTAILQALLSAIGFWIAGVPGVPLLSLLCFVVTLAQLSTGLVWIPAAIWLGYEGATAALVFTIVWHIGVNLVDNIAKPWLMGRGSDLPLAVVFLGVIGGLLAWGFLGMFLGATLLATAYILFRAWVDFEEATEEAPPVV